MDDLLKKSMVELLNYIKQGVNFVESQAPLVAQEYLRFHACAALADKALRKE